MQTTNRSSDFFITKEIEKITYIKKESWSIVILKELIDNALDAIEKNIDKQIDIEYTNNTLKIFDNGDGIATDIIKNRIYNFYKYASDNRHVITAARGKQGYGLKVIIGICSINNYSLHWHTAEGIELCATVDRETIYDDVIGVDYVECGETIRKGIEIRGIKIRESSLNTWVSSFSDCNPDVTFTIKLNQRNNNYPVKNIPTNKTKETSLAFYTYQDLIGLIKAQEDKSETYKDFLGRYFGLRIKNDSKIKTTLDNLDLSEVRQDFDYLRDTLPTKPWTILKKHTFIIDKNSKNKLEAFCNIDVDGEKISVPCLVEYEIKKLSDDDEYEDNSNIRCYINNSVTYFDGASIEFEWDTFYMTSSNSKKQSSYVNDLKQLLRNFNNYYFKFHFITPYPKFKNTGKTLLDITDFVNELAEKIKSFIINEQKKEDRAREKIPTKKSLAEKHMTEAFLIMSSNNTSPAIARQIFYKLREIINHNYPDYRWGKNKTPWDYKNVTYNTFTGKWLTEWMDDPQNAEYEKNVHFSERGNFYCDGEQMGLGTAQVVDFIEKSERKTNKFIIYGGLQQSKVYVDDSLFNLKYKYSGALYTEKTGFDTIFKQVGLAEKYNLLLVSGQGFATRAGRRLLYYFQEQGLKLYCLHDLDADGITIFDAMSQANDKFPHDLYITDLGVSIDDVEHFGIKPESVETPEDSVLKTIGEKFGEEYRRWFTKGQRVELSAFTTDQLLHIIDKKLKDSDVLPTVNLEDLDIDHRALRQTAYMQVVQERIADKLDEINIDYVMSNMGDMITLPKAKEKIQEITNSLISQYVEEIKRRKIV